MKSSGYNSIQSWRIVAACSFIHCLMVIPVRTTSMLFVAFVDRYNTNRQNAAFFLIIIGLIRTMGGPVVGYLGQMIDLKYIITIGCCIASVGVGLCFIAKTIVAVNISLGLVYGTGYALALTLIPQVLKQHFNKGIANANGLVNAVSLMGVFGFIPIFAYLINVYGVSGSLLITSGIILNCIPIAMLLKDPKYYELSLTLSSIVQNEKCIDNVCNNIDANLTRTGRIISNEHAITPIESCKYKFPSVHTKVFDACETTGCNKQPKKYQQHLKKISLQLHPITNLENKIELKTNERCETSNELISSERSDTLNELKTSERCEIFNELISSERSETLNELKTSERCETVNELIVSERSETLKKLMSNERYEILNELKTNERPEAFNELKTNERPETVNAIETNDRSEMVNELKTNERSETINEVPLSNKRSRTGRLKKFKNSLKGFQVFSEPSFLVIMICECLHFYIEAFIMTVIVDISRDKDIAQSQEKYFPMALLVAETAGYTCLGWVTDKGHLTVPNFMAVCFLCLGLSNCGFVFSNSLPTMMAVTLAFGIASAGIGIVMPVVIYEFVEESKHNMAIASKSFIYAPLSFTIAPVIGYFRDSLGSYNGALYLLTGIGVLASFLVSLLPKL